jgi:hypothetical protein
VRCSLLAFRIGLDALSCEIEPKQIERFLMRTSVAPARLGSQTQVSNVHGTLSLSFSSLLTFEKGREDPQACSRKLHLPGSCVPLASKNTWTKIGCETKPWCLCRCSLPQALEYKRRRSTCYSSLSFFVVSIENSNRRQYNLKRQRSNLCSALRSLLSQRCVLYELKKQTPPTCWEEEEEGCTKTRT